MKTWSLCVLRVLFYCERDSTHKKRRLLLATRNNSVNYTPPKSYPAKDMAPGRLCVRQLIVARRDRIVVSTLRCGRNNPGSNPGHGSVEHCHGR